MQKKYLIWACSLLVSTGLFGQSNGNIILGAELLITNDISIQTPRDEPSFTTYLIGNAPALSLLVERRLKKNFWFSSGYRYKNHWITIDGRGLHSGSEWSKISHSLPVKLAWKKTFLHNRRLKKFGLDINAGALCSYFTDDIIILGMSTTRSGPNDTMIISSYVPKQSDISWGISVDASIKLEYLLWKRISIHFGYGNTYGFRPLTALTYSLKSTSRSESGISKIQGSYTYFILGAKYLIKPKFWVSHSKK